MSMEEGLPNSMLLGWATSTLRLTGEFDRVWYDAQHERVILVKSGKVYKLFIELGRPVVELMDEPAY